MAFLKPDWLFLAAFAVIILYFVVVKGRSLGDIWGRITGNPAAPKASQARAYFASPMTTQGTTYRPGMYDYSY